jgi:hypothetical protein
MVDPKSETWNVYDLAKALGRWDNEGETAGSQQMQHASLSRNEERILKCLGAAVIMQWNDLPTEIQRSLFMDAASMSDPDRQFQLKQQIARLLHVHKDDV